MTGCSAESVDPVAKYVFFLYVFIFKILNIYYTVHGIYRVIMNVLLAQKVQQLFIQWLFVVN